MYGLLIPISGQTMCICQGEKSVFKFKVGQELVPTNKCSIAWRIE